MALQEIMELSCMRGQKKQGISEERIKSEHKKELSIYEAVITYPGGRQRHL